jgi:hypothetical protein
MCTRPCFPAPPMDAALFIFYSSMSAWSISRQRALLLVVASFAIEPIVLLYARCPSRRPESVAPRSGRRSAVVFVFPSTVLFLRTSRLSPAQRRRRDVLAAAPTPSTSPKSLCWVRQRATHPHSSRPRRCRLSARWPCPRFRQPLLASTHSMAR